MKLSRELKIGFFAIAMLVCLYLGVNYLKGRQIFSGDRFYYALFDRTNGLQTSAQVLLRGVKVGSVVDIYLDGEYPDKVVVKVGVKKSVDIPSDSHLVLMSNGLMGEKAIGLVMGVSESYFGRDVVIPAQIEGGLLESAGSSIEDLVAEAKTVMNSLAATSASLNDILTQNADSFNGILNNAESVTRQLSDARLDDMIRDLGAFTTMLRDNSERFGGIIGNLDHVTGELAQADLKGTVDDLGASVANLNAVMAKLSEGDGTAAQLLDNPALYDSLNVAAGNLAALLDDLKANPNRYVHFSLFGKRDKEKK